MLNVYGDAIRCADQTDGYFIFYNVSYKKEGDKKEQKRERERGRRRDEFLVATLYLLGDERKIYIVRQLIHINSSK